MTDQLTMSVPAPGYYSHMVTTRDRTAGTGSVSWHPDEETARAHAIACFDRGYRTWPENQRPHADRVELQLLVPGPDLGAWSELTQEQRSEFTKDHPWFVSRKGAA